MKHSNTFLVSILLLGLTCNLFSQPLIGGRLRNFNSDFHKKITAPLESKYALRTHHNRTYIAALAQINSAYKASDLENLHIIAGGLVGDVLSLQIPLNKLADACQYAGFSYLEAARKATPLLNISRQDANADLVNQGVELHSRYTGKNVIIGITDWGFDYTHPTFYDTTLSRYRILAAWDQYRHAGPAPVGFTYGSEWTTQVELLAAKSDTCNIYDYGTHGTHVAGIAGGSGATTKYRGMACEAEFLFATWLIDEAAILDAYTWMRTKAQEAGKRLVINGSWGLYHFGSMDGSSLFDRAIDSLSINDNIVFVSSAGNNGGSNFHLAMSGNNDTLRSRIGFLDYAAPAYNYWGETITMSSENTESYAARIEIYNENWDLLDSSPWSSPMDQPFVFSYNNGVDSVEVAFHPEGENPFSHRKNHEISVRLTRPNLHPFHIVLATAVPSGMVHAWNVIELRSTVGNTGMPFFKARPEFINGDSQYSIGEPATASECIAVAAHSGVKRNSTDHGLIANFSSEGPIVGGDQKPDISAPGVAVVSAISSFESGTHAATGFVRFNGKVYIFSGMSGTSMSAPCVTGCIALMLEANPHLTPNRIKQIIRSTARQDETTGTTPNFLWGYGKMDAHAAVKQAESTLSLQPVLAGKIDLTVYPNPTTDHINLYLRDAQATEIYLTDITGKRIASYPQNTTFLSLQNYATGLYLLHVCTAEGVAVSKILKQ